ncbi:MAG: Spy/CpxP family protein refolding chaperone [Phenylobacterium sp.]|uniref:Spy/CpxP family protein refolding chaperone n=1 Tax=Phenylobacterium sp. TaxID=1871053 RepID=UPI001A4CE7C4|nr:Spy/CpxP family protein refolding chaperone [Phenylobacterium sp.]MBL8772504.1 Spy/CpxP family protein refolding chaperone [Phenylobacterium sp.]
MQRRLIFALAPLALAAGAAFAQPSGPGPEVRMMRHGGPPPEEMKARHEAMMKQHAEDLKILLRLRPDQEAALSAFLASHGPQRMERRMTPDDKPMTTPQRLEEMARREEAMRTAHARRREALARFYAALSADQQKAFDALQRLRGHGGPGHGPMMGGGRGMMMHGGPVERRVIIRKDAPDAPHGH